MRGIAHLRFPKQRAITSILAFIIIGGFLYVVRDILPPFIIAFFLASLLDPIVTNQERHGRSRARAVTTIYALFFLLIILLSIAVIPPALRQTESIVNKLSTDTFTKQLQTTLTAWQHRNHKILDRVGITQAKINSWFTLRSSTVQEGIKRVLVPVQSFIYNYGSRIIWIVIIPILTFYFLLDYHALRIKLISFLPGGSQRQVDRISREIIEIFFSYIRSLTIVCALYGFAAAILFYLLGVPYALLVGLAAGIFYAVPYVGPLLTIVTACTLAVTASQAKILFLIPINPHTFIYALMVFLLWGAIQLTFDQVITPRVVGGSVGLHPVASIFALMVGAQIFGIVGMVLAFPVAASVQRVLCYYFPKLALRADELEKIVHTVPEEEITDGDDHPAGDEIPSRSTTAATT